MALHVIAQKLLQTGTRCSWRGLPAPAHQLKRHLQHQAQSLASQNNHGGVSGAPALSKGSSSCRSQMHSWLPVSQSWQGCATCPSQRLPERRHLSSGSSRVHAAAPESTGSPSTERKIYALLYTYVEGILEKRAPHRPQHLALCQALQEEGLLLLGGALGNPPTDGLLVLRAASVAEVERRLVLQDPYYTSGLVTAYKILPWTVVIGSLD